MRVALASCRTLPEPDPDETLLASALAAVGVEAEVPAWDDPGVAWDRYRACVLRSTWNYYRRPEAFLAWAGALAARIPLWNPLPVVRWNAHKGYLAALEARGVAITPTEFLARGDGAELAAIATARRWTEVVIKPTVSAASFATVRAGAGDLAAAQAHLAAHLGERDMMVQRYLPSVEGYGERALIWIDGALTHAVRKSPRFGGDDEAVSGALPIAADERAFAEQVLAATPMAERLLYARIDVARDDDGTLKLMELELIEPSLFLLQHPPALTRLAAAIKARALGSQPVVIG